MEALKVLNDRYQLLAVIKRGGFGTIYKGYDSVLAKDIAVKEINEDLLGDAWYIDQFQNEARHVAKLNHQNIVHIFDLVKTEDGRFYIVMEHIDGLDLSKLLQECRTNNTPLPHHLGIHVIAEICKALDYAHNCTHSDTHEPLNLVHQDISPSNIMIGANGMVKLIDFGIAGVQKRTVLQDYISLQGKVQYMSPEHVDPERAMDKRADLFSLGLVLFEVLEGKRFFQSENSQEVVEILNNGKLKLKKFDATPKPLQKIVGKALEKTPEKRYQNANQFYIDLVTYFVVNANSATVHTELTGFVAGFMNGGNKTAPRQGPTELDLEFDSIHPHDDDEVSNYDITETIPTEDTDSDNTEELKTDTSPLPITIDSTRQDYSEPLLPGDEIKTVIDAVRLSARGHKKQIKFAFLGLLALLLLFFALDVSQRWTPLGETVYDFFLPPAIKVASKPAGAKVFLNDNPIDGVTPLAIEDIQPGIYELRLTLDDYNPIIKSIRIPSKGDIRIKGEESRRGNQPYVFSFKTTLELASIPPGAEVFINGIKYGQRTPCSVTWEVGEPCVIEMKHAGFPDLSGFNLDSETMVEQIDDHRLWQFEITQEPVITYSIQGKFGKYVAFTSNPVNADIFLDDNSEPVGKTGRQNKIFLTAESHKIVLKKDGYVPRALNVQIDESTPEAMFATLARPVRFSAYDATDGSSEDLIATISELVRNGRTVIRERQTPARINLLPYDYYATFTKEGYKTARVNIAPDDQQVIARMERLSGQISVIVLDAESNEPIRGVQVQYKSLDNSDAPEENFAVTDEDGTGNGYLQAGLYLFSVNRPGYQYHEKSLKIVSDDLNLIEFNLKKL